MQAFTDFTNSRAQDATMPLNATLSSIFKSTLSSILVKEQATNWRCYGSCVDLGGFVEEGPGAGVVAGVAERAHDGHAGALEALRQRRAQRLAVFVPQVAPAIAHHLLHSMPRSDIPMTS